MATAIRLTIEQHPTPSLTTVYSAEAIVDDVDHAREQGADVAALLSAFEEGVREAWGIDG